MSTIVVSQRPTDVSPKQITEGEEPGLVDTVRAGFRLAEDKQEMEQFQLLAERYDALLDTLSDVGVDTSEKGALYKDVQSQGYAMRTFRVPDRAAIIAEVQRQRVHNPMYFGTLPNSREEFERASLNRFGGRARDQLTVARGNGVAGLWGGMASAMTDPINAALMLIGAGEASLVKTMLIEGLAGGTGEIIQLPSTARATKRLGEDFTAGDAVKQVLTSAGASAVLGGGFKGVEIATPKVGAAVGARVDGARAQLESLIADNWDRLPEAVRTRWAKAASIADGDLPDLAEAIIGRGNMSVDERANIDALRRDAEIDAASPFKTGAAGDAGNRVMLDDALAVLLQPVQRRAAPFAMPVRPSSTARGDLRAGTANSGASGGEGTGGGRAALKARIRTAESGGNDAARNPLSSATGRYQFTGGTWLAYYKRRFGDQGMSDDAILAKRSDGRLQETLMDDLTADNARFLRTVGEAESAGNLYLVHFAGTGGARKLFGADPDARAADVLGAGVVKANPWLRDYSAGDVIAWAHRKMNEAVPRRAGARSELADDGAAYRDQLQAEIDRIEAERDAARAGADDPFSDAMDAIGGAGGRAAPDPRDQIEPVFVDVELEPLPPLRTDPAARPRQDDLVGITDREIALIAPLRAEIAGSARLSDVEGLAKRLEANEDEIRRVLGRLAATDRQIVIDSKGRARRVPSDKGPVDAFKFLARAGGIADSEGHGLSEIFGVDARTTRTDPLTGGRISGMRRQSKNIPGAGPLIRKGGGTMDWAGEYLHEGGFLTGADGGRPTIAETIDYLARGMESPEVLRTMVAMDRLGEGDAYVAPQTLADMTEHMREWANYQDVGLDSGDMDALARLMLRDDIRNEAAAAQALLDGKFLDALNDARYEDGNYDADLAAFLDHQSYGADSGRSEFDPGDAREGGFGAADGGRAGEVVDDTIDIESAASAAGWNSATDRLAVQQADSVIHDLDAVHGAADGAVPPDDIPFYLDENGEPRSWADIKAELDLDEIEIKYLRDCL